MSDSRPSARGQDKQAEQSYYDRLFSTRRKFDQFQTGIYDRIADEARRATEGTRALEIGCGSGSQAVRLIERGFDVLALDLSIEAVKLARAAVGESPARPFAVLNADAEHLPVRDESVDACICGLLLHHFLDLGAVAAEIRRVLRPGGVVVAIDANAHNPFAWMFFNVVHRLRPLSRLTPNQRALWAGEIRREFGRQGFADFRFDSMTSDLRKDWLGNSFGAKLNFYSRRAVLGLSRLALPKLSQGNMLLSVFKKLPQ